MGIVVALIGLAAVAIAYLAVGWQWALLTLLAYVFVFIYGQRRDWRGAFAWCLLLSFFGIAVTGGLFAQSIEDSIPSFLLGAAIATLAYVAAATMMFAACTEIYIVWRGADRRRAWRMAFGFILSAVFPSGILNPFSRMFRGIQIVTDGKVTYSLPPSESVRMLGPVMLVVHVGNAVVLDRTGQITRIVGPGFYTTDPFETIYSVVNLQPQTGELQVDRVLTKDSIPLRIRFTVLYQIRSDQAALLTRGLFRIDQDAIRRAVLCTTDRDWRGYTESVARNTLCDTIASRYLDEIYDPRGLTPGAPRVPLQHMLRRRLSQEAQGWGVEIIRVTLDEISMPEEVSQRMIEAWDVNWRHVVELARAITDARTIVTAASGAGRAARISAEAEALARLQAVGIDGDTSLIEAVGAQRLALAQQEVARLQAVGQSRARLEAARVDAEIGQVNAVGAALAELRAAEVESNTERVRLVGRARAQLQAAGIEMNIRQLEAFGAAIAELQSAEIQSETERVRLTGQARARLQAAGIEMDIRQVEALAAAMADLRAAEVESDTERVRLVGRARAQLQAAGIEMDVHQLEAFGAAVAELRAAEVKSLTAQVTEAGKAAAQLGVARVGQEIAEVEAERARIEAEGRAQVTRIERSAETTAEAERFRTVLRTLQQIVGPDLMKDMTQELVRVLTTVNDVQAFLRVMRWDRRALPPPGGEAQGIAGGAEAGEDTG